MATRLYFSLTNNCNLACPFCCMHSAPGKKTYFPPSRVEAIFNRVKRPFELQMEGGEPFLSPNWYNCMLKAYATGLCQKVIICTNGILLKEHLDYVKDFMGCFPIIIKISINYHIYQNFPGCITQAEELVAHFKDQPEIKFILNVRIGKHPLDDLILEKIRKAGLFGRSNIFPFQRYGRAKNDETLKYPHIAQNIEDWYLFASDGKNFGHDLIARSEYEETLP